MNKTKPRRILYILGICFAFPALIVLLAEYIQMSGFYELIGFIVEKPGIILLDIVLAILFFGLTVFLFKSLWVSAAVSGLVFYTLSCIEYYKYGISGSHLVISDFLMVGSISDITGFAELQISLRLICAFFILAVTVFAISKSKIKLAMRLTRRLYCLVLCVVTVSLLVIPSNALQRTHEMLELDIKPAKNSFHLDERFKNNGFLAFLYYDASETIQNRVEPPQNYGRAAVESLLAPGDLPDGSREDMPNIIFVLSESFADLRELCADIPREIYSFFDKSLAKGISGDVLVPTFGGYTVRSEFELLFGLPVNSLKNPEIPHYLLSSDAESALTFADFYKNQGYATAYIHPFSRTFYERDGIYSKYGFDSMYFSDNLTVPLKISKRYIDDITVMEQIKQILKQDIKPSFIFATTMQNHQPYFIEDEVTGDELEYYLDGVKTSADALYEFLCYLDGYEEKVILVFLGDHFPFFTPQGMVYDRLGLNDENIPKLYYQKCLIYSNYDINNRDTFKKPVSAFYLPHMISDIANTRKTPFINTMLKVKEETPVYSISASGDEENMVLDMLTYDRVLGDGYSEKN